MVMNMKYYKNYLFHHGVKGQKWGVRRYQDSEGHYTELGRKRNIAANRIRRTEKTRKQVDEIFGSLSKKDKNMLNADDGYLSFEQGEYVVKRILVKKGDTPVAFLDFLSDGTNKSGKENLSVAIATRSDAQGKGYGYEAAKKGADWIDKNRDKFGYVEWAAKTDNTSSQRLAEKVGYKYNKRLSDDKWEVYRK